MKKLTNLGLVLLILAGCGGPQETIEEAPNTYTISQFMKTVTIGGSSFSPDESKILFSSDETGVRNSYSIGIDGTGKTALTNSTDNYNISLSYFPNDERFLFTSDEGGNEINHIYLRNADGTIEDLTPDPEAKSQFYGWSHDRKSFFFTSNKRDPQYFDLSEMTIEDSDPGSEGNVMSSEVVFENNQGYGLGNISPNKRYVALSQPITTSSNHLFVYDRESGEIKQINDPDEKNSYSDQYFSLDNKKLILTTDKDNEFSYLISYDIETGEREKIYETDWDVMYAYQSFTGRYRVIATNEDAKTAIRIEDTSNGTVVDLPKMPDADISSVSISRSEKLMAFYVNSTTSSRNLYVYNFSTGEYKKLTDTMNSEINQNDMVKGEVIRFTSFDGMEIPAILYKPKGIKEGELRPALLDIHGGPGGQRRLNYYSNVQYLVNHGYVVLQVNNRGSSGYGKSFYKADDKKHGDVDLRDCIESKKFLIATGYVDPEKIGIMGGSYGGYMTMAALAFAPEEFTVGVNYFGVTNWLRTLKSIPPWWTSFKDALYDELGDPYADSVALYNKSPLFHAEKITKPFIVLQGSNDPRVLQVESDEIVEAAKNNNVPVEYVIFEDEGHGFIKKENQVEASESVLKFLDKHLWKKSETE